MASSAKSFPFAAENDFFVDPDELKPLQSALQSLQSQTNEKGSGSVGVLELFSGVGGFRLGLEYAGLKVDEERSVAVDINTTALDVYCWNFFGKSLKTVLADSKESAKKLMNESKKKRRTMPGEPVQGGEEADVSGPSTAVGRNPFKAPVSTANIETLETDKFKGFDVWTMSPPCQPYSRQGNQLDTEDPRAFPLKRIENAVEELGEADLPSLVMLENVKGFEVSDGYLSFLKTLKKAGYSVHCYLLTPEQLGFPNSRTRFYMVADRRGSMAADAGRIPVLAEEYCFDESLINTKKLSDGFLPVIQDNVIDTEIDDGLEEGDLRGDVIHAEGCEGVNVTGTLGVRNAGVRKGRGVFMTRRNMPLFTEFYGLDIQSKTECPHGMIYKESMRTVGEVLAEVREERKRVGVSIDGDCEMDDSPRTEEPEETKETTSTAMDVEQETEKTEAENEKNHPFAPTPAEFLCNDAYLLPTTTLAKSASTCLDLVYARCQHSSCFTGNYSRFLNGAGSVLVTDDLFQPTQPGTDKPIDLQQEKDMLLWNGKLRWFTPEEAFALMGFRPKDFQQGLERARKEGGVGDNALWKCCGNSLNPQVVGGLLGAHLSGWVPQVWRNKDTGEMWCDGRLPM